MPWVITHSVLYHHQQDEFSHWEDIGSETTGDAERAEALARHFANHVIACDDVRFEGPGTPISSQITITWKAN